MKPTNLDKIDANRIQTLVENYKIPEKEHKIEHQAQVNALVNYYRELIPSVRAFIRRINQPEQLETVKISEGVQKRLRYGVLLNPLSTFASNFESEKSEQSMALLRLYVDLDEVYSYLYSTRDWANEQIHLDKFVSRHDLELVELVLQQMYDYLNTVLRNMYSIYTYAVGFYYGTDTDSEVLNYRMLQSKSPYIISSPLLRVANINFMYFFVMASQIFYQPKSSFLPQSL
ncbi:hypothetical protein CJP74_05205 [Psittacicella melopsittaci]|uniref:Uncharacterized protein n=1 Tax=Psittacicella melopsittaci TaxID=2028576 RepID=A0A3A1Y4H8_9GAMM|nr:hypothetical protein [Psittacicella melopsittaci]RIY32166.1 hypothetical protein CJP74_05205 [Psittacicella melopsittaci]